MRSARLLRALAGATGPRTSSSVRRSLLQLQLCRALSSAAGKPPSNPFEIDLGALTAPVSTSEKLTLSDAKRAAEAQQAEAQHDIELLHDEMSGLFGEQVAEYAGDAAPSSVEEAVAAFDKRVEAREQVVVKPEVKEVEEVPPAPAKKAVRAVEPKKKVGTKESRSHGAPSAPGSSSVQPVDVLLLQGPCSFVRGVWTGGNVKIEELRSRIQELADGLGIVVKDRNYDSEQIILSMLLDAREDQVTVLQWNVSLSKSPLVVRALELSQSRVIIVSPVGVEHGPLPSSVVGVLSGFWNQSMSLAINAAANLLDSDSAKKAKPRTSSKAKNTEKPANVAKQDEEEEEEGSYLPSLRRGGSHSTQLPQEVREIPRVQKNDQRCHTYAPAP